VEAKKTKIDPHFREGTALNNLPNHLDQAETLKALASLQGFFLWALKEAVCAGFKRFLFKQAFQTSLTEKPFKGANDGFQSASVSFSQQLDEAVDKNQRLAQQQPLVLLPLYV